MIWKLIFDEARGEMSGIFNGGGFAGVYVDVMTEKSMKN
jgi:hypothetical protein